jgi:hypothetical protein
MGIEKMETELEEEIRKTEERLVQLRQIKAIVNSMQSPATGNILKTFPNAVPLGKIKRKLKYTQFTQVETKQAINIWNSMKDMPNMNQQTIVSHIAKTLKYPYKKVYNKVYWLKRLGKIAVPQGMSTTEIMTNTKKRRGYTRSRRFNWTEAQKQQLAQLTRQGRLPKEISAIMTIDTKTISNRLNRMRASGEIVRVRQKQAVPRNPLLNLK